MVDLVDLYDVPPPRCEFFGGPWAYEVKVMDEAPLVLVAPVPVQVSVQVSLFDVPQSPSMETAVYRLRGIDDDGTRRYYLDE